MIYSYQIINDDGTQGETFEIDQSPYDPNLTTHPVTGQKVKKIFNVSNINIKYTTSKTAKILDEKNIAKAGFTKYERDKQTGAYNKICGQGPNKITPEQFKD